MANQLGSNPWVLDTPGTAILFAGDIHACHFEWSGGAAGNAVEVQDRNGKKIWAAVWATNQSLIESFTISWVYGLALTILQGGVVRVYYE